MRIIHLFLASVLSLSSVAFAETESTKLNPSNEKVGEATSGTQLTSDCGSLTARSLFYVCNRIQEPNLQGQCFNAGRNAYLDQCALGACDRYQTAQGTIGCIDAIANREYTLSEVLDCDSITAEATSNQCFAATGQYYSGNGQNAETRRLRRGIEDAIFMIDRQNYLEARRTLDNLLK